jgi:valyl-tRNA synthetase
MNTAIFERFRKGCDTFFEKKAQFFQALKESLNENLAKKKELVEKAESLKDSTEWRSTGDILVNLQKQWKEIGNVPHKYSEELWKRFVGACDHFFEARQQATAGVRDEQNANKEQKLGIIEQLKALATETGEEVADKVQKLVDEYNAVGHVPYKEKDKLYKEYHAVLDKLYKDLNISVAKRKLNNFKQNLKNVAERGENALDNERTRLFRQYENLKSEIQTYENNLGFLNASSKKGNSLIDEMNRKVQKLKDDMNLIREKIKAIDAENKQ